MSLECDQNFWAIMRHECRLKVTQFLLGKLQADMIFENHSSLLDHEILPNKSQNTLDNPSLSEKEFLYGV